MTIALAWLGQRRDGREYLYMASDSRVTGGRVLDACPKILTLPRSDCAICFAGDTNNAYPLMLQIWNAIAAHQPASDRSLDIATLKQHLLRLCTDLIAGVRDAAYEIAARDAQFIFGGFSWRARAFRLWTIYWDSRRRAFAEREAVRFHHKLSKAAFIGDHAKPLRSKLVRLLAEERAQEPIELEPLKVLAEYLRDSPNNGSVGGAPQVVRIASHLNTRPLVVRWKGNETLFGRPLFSYENVDYWSVDPFLGELGRPRSFGIRMPQRLSSRSKTVPAEPAATAIDDTSAEQ